MPFDNRRDQERFELKLPTCISVPAINPEKECLFLVTDNVCCKGAFFKTPDTLPEGTDVKIDLKLPPKANGAASYLVGLVKVTGRVVRTSGEGMAIAFNDDFRLSSQHIHVSGN